MLQEMFKVMSARFHAATQTFASLIDSVVDYSLKPVKASSAIPGNARYVPIPIDSNKFEKKR